MLRLILCEANKQKNDNANDSSHKVVAKIAAAVMSFNMKCVDKLNAYAELAFL